MRLLVLFLLALIILASCTGTKARDNVALPALVLASEGVQADCTSGIATLPAADQPAAQAVAANFFATMHSKDRAAIANTAVPSWPQVKSWAVSGIAARQAAGTIGPDVATLLRERLANYEMVLLKSAVR